MTRRSRTVRGSAFLAALLTLAILTIIGLSLAMVTETEMLLGANERVIGESFYATESGVSAATAKMVIASDLGSLKLVVPSHFPGTNNQQLGYELRSTGTAPITFEELPYSKANENRGARYFGSYYSQLVRAQRLNWNRNQQVPSPCDANSSVMAERYLATGFYFGPTNEPPAIELQKSVSSAWQGSHDLCDGANTLGGDNSLDLSNDSSVWENGGARGSENAGDDSTSVASALQQMNQSTIQ